jgi:hypothetical protein
MAAALWWILSNSKGGSQTKFTVVQSATAPKPSGTWPNAPIGPFQTRAEALQVISTAQKEGGFGLSKGSATGAGLQAGAASLSWLNPLSAAQNFFSSIGGMIAAGFEKGFIQIIKDIWNVILGPLEVLLGLWIAIVVLAIYFKNDIAGLASTIALAAA